MRILLTLALLAALPTVASAHGRVFVESNAPDGNEVLVFDRGAGGALHLAAHVATGGRGSGAGLGSQGALALSAGGSLLFAVNAGSDDVSVFAVERRGLQLLGRTPTGGSQPVSLAAHRDRLYVLDAGGDGDVAAFRLGHDGRLTPLGQRALANRAPGPAQVAVSPSGDTLVVTEKGTNCIDTFALDDGGRIGAGSCHPSAGTTPFGFAFAPPAWDWFGNRYDTLVVSEAAGGAPGASTVSTYLVADGDVEPLAPAVRTEGTAACWVALANGGRTAYTTDTGSAAVTGFRLHDDGALRLLAPDGKSGDTGAGSHPIDAAVAASTLFVLDVGTPSLQAFAIRGDGRLAPLSSVGGVTAFAAGLVAE